MLDMKTLMITFVVNSLLNTIVMFIYWRQNRKYFKGISHWTLSLGLQSIGFVLLSARGILPDLITIVFSNVMIVAASFHLYLGFKEFVGYKARNTHNIVLLVIYALLQYYYGIIDPDTSMRIILISIFCSFMFIQSGMLLFNSKKHDLTTLVRTSAVTCYIYVVVQMYRVIVELIEPTTDYFDAGTLATSAQVANQFLTIVIVFTLIITVNKVNLNNLVKNEMKLKDKEEQLQNFVDNSHDWQVWIKNDGNFEYMSSAVERITGYSYLEFIENPDLLFNIIHPEDQHLYKNHFHEDNCILQYRIINKEGNIRWIEHACQKFYSTSGNALGRHGSNRDITEKKEFEEQLSGYNLQLEEDVSEKIQEISEAQRASALALARLAEARDLTTGQHVDRVQYLCKELTKALASDITFEEQITPSYIDSIFYASILHDIGKVAVPDAILMKNGRLTSKEFDIVKTHVEIGANTLEEISLIYPHNPIIEMGIQIARYHHEKWNGKGYLMGLEKRAIPLAARIMAVIDVYDALRSQRPYKEAISHSNAIEIIYKDSGQHFDPDIIRVFQEIEQKIEQIYDSISID